MIKAILAADQKDGIGYNGTLPWPHNQNDLKWFKSKTENNVVVMGRKTWSDHKMPKPLPNRFNIVVSSNTANVEGAPNLIVKLENLPKLLTHFTQDVWIIGGAQLFSKTLKLCEELHISRIQESFYCTTFMPEYKNDFYLAEEHKIHDKKLYTEIWKKV